MFPSLAAWGGMSGLLGLREVELGAVETVATLNQGYQRHPDTCWVDYANLMREPGGKPKTPIATLTDKSKPPQSTVALVGGGIGNIIAAYELSRVGVRCTLFEATDRLGGRLYSPPFNETSTYRDLGAMKFPRGGLMWHYVAQWVRWAEHDLEDVDVAPFPHAGTVPTMVTYQGKTYEWTPTLDQLPPVFGDAKAMFTDYFRGLNDGAPDPQTIYFPEVQGALRSAPSDATTSTVRLFWKAMIRRFDGRSFGEVLQTEVFARANDVPYLLATFGTLGLGTGGFGPLYEVAFLEVLRRLLWDRSDEFFLPASDEYPSIYPPGSGSAQGFAMGLSRAAYAEAKTFYKDVTYASMFRLQAPVTRVQSFDHGVEVTVDGKGLTFGNAVVGMTSGAMQAMGVDQSYPDAPLLPSTHVTDLVRPSVSAAVRRENTMSAYKMFATLPSPGTNIDWPVNSSGKKILCFLTDQAPRAAYVLPSKAKQTLFSDVLLSDASGDDAIKFEAMSTEQRVRLISNSFAYGVQPKGGGGDGPTAGLARTIRNALSAGDVVWNEQPYVGGGFKLDHPEDNYFSDSLFFHYTVADPTSGAGPSTVFFCGDSVGHLGGWVEGAAMSAVNAVAAVCTRIQTKEPQVLQVADRFAQLLSPRTMLFHRWQSIGGLAPSLRGINTMYREGNWEENPALPATWRYERLFDDGRYNLLSVSKWDDLIVTAELTSWFHFWEKDDDGLWSERDSVSLGDLEPTSLSVATDGGLEEERLTQLMIVDQQGQVWHRTRQGGTWSEAGRPWSTLAQRVALDVESFAAQVVIVDKAWDLRHGIRYPDRWSDLGYVPGPNGERKFDVIDADVSCTDITHDLTTVAAIDAATQSVYVTVRDGRAGGGTWRPWVRLPSPLVPGLDDPMQAVQVRVVVLDAGNAQILALFADNQTETPHRLYSSVRNLTADPAGGVWTTFRPVPYPYSGEAGSVGDFAPVRDDDSYHPPLSSKNYGLVWQG